MKDTIKVNLPHIKMIAHRGVSGLERENTNAAFVAAGNRSYWGIETDVYRTKDGHFLVIHDDGTERVAGVNLVVEETDFAELRAIRMNDLDGHPRGDLMFPTLAEYITICKKYDKEAVLELKNRFTPEDIGRIVGIVRNCGWLERTVFISFSYENCVNVRMLLPDQRIQYLRSEFQEDSLDKLLAYRFDLDISWTGVNEEQVKRCIANGIHVNCWTCDEVDVAHRLADWGVEYLTTNILE